MSEERLKEIHDSIEFQMQLQQAVGYKSRYDDLLVEEIDLYNEVIDLQQENQQLKEAIKRCYTPEEIDFEIMPVKAELEAEKDINNNLHKTIDKLRVNLYETQQERDLYKEVVEKVREYINHEWFKRGQLGIIDKSFQEWQLKKLLQILDKVKEIR